VEAAADGNGRVLIRDTQNRTGAVLKFAAQPWLRFAQSIKTEG
jgi:hypothetical protein